MKTLSIVVPVFNEEANISLMRERIDAVFLNLPYDYELIYVNDGSSDASGDRVLSLATDPRIKYIELSRNFGKEIALSAGIIEANGDAILTIDADLQHPPERIPDFITEWEQGAEVVVGVRNPRTKEKFLRKLFSRSFSTLMNSLGDIQSPSGATDFRLIDRMVADEFRKLTEHQRLTRALIDWLGFKRSYVFFDAAERENGDARYNYRKLFGTAFFAIVAHTRFPLWLAGYLGAGITVLSGMLGLFIIIEQVLLGDPLGIDFTGPAMLAIMILFLNGIVLISLWLISLYISTIHTEAAGRPLYVTRRKVNLE